MDFGCIYGGYCSDMTRTVVIGRADTEMKKVYQTVLDAQLAAIAAVREGVTGAELDRIARDIIYGAGYESMDCPGLLKDFHTEGTERWHIGVLHGEVSALSSYCPMTKEHIRQSGLHYLALGHIHKGGSVRADDTLCAWPGCPMGHGYDELGAKGVILVQLNDTVQASFLPIDTPRFFNEELDVGDNAADALASLLPALDSSDFYRVTLTGYSAPLDLNQLAAQFPHIANLQLRDETLPELDLWSSVGEDTLEGVYFGLLQNSDRSDSENLSRRARLAARISRQILDGQEVKLP